MRLLGTLGALLLVISPTVNGFQELDAENIGLNLEPDGHLSMQRAKDEHLKGVVMRTESKPLEHGGGYLAMVKHNASLMEKPLLSSTGLKCNTPIFAPADPCPFECPYLAEDALQVCHFRCLEASACGSLDPLAKIADDQDWVCRRCKVVGCNDCIPGTKDECRECKGGYKSDGKGGCWAWTYYVMLGIKILCLIVALLGGFWLIELSTRKKTNWRGLKHGLAFRWRTRIHMPLDTSDEDGIDDTDNQDEQIHEQLLYPLSTNMLRQPVAGPGLALHMNYFCAVILWSAVIIYMYALCACMVSIDMLILGLSPAKTSQQLCAVIHWGRESQMQNIWAKTTFVIFTYLFTFLGCMYLAFHQHWTFHRLDDEVTMKDFCAYVSGLPKMKGSDNPEEDLRKFLESQTHQKVRGVSICWDYSKQKKEVMEAIEDDWKEREAALAPPPPDESVNPVPRQPPLGFFRRQIRRIDCFFGFDPPKKGAPQQGEGAAAEGAGAPLLADRTGPSAQDITKILTEMESSDVAFVIFNSEEERDAAIENCTLKQGLEYNGAKLEMSSKWCEPQSVNFSGLCWGTNTGHRQSRIIRGCWITLAALLIWCALFYLPYAYYMMSFSYAHGEEPGLFANLMFSLLVVGGNQLMYYLADIISSGADFAFDDDRELAYNYIYVFACVMNVILDLLIVLWLAYKMMIGIGVHTADDRLLESLTSFHDIFESYPIQKMFGELLFEYAYPSCFFYPFIAEALFTITLPFYVGKYIVLSHDEVQGRDAELSMQYFLPMNLGRYGDIILNMIIACLVFFCPGGFTLPMFVAFMFCHVGIFLYDHWRILRSTPNFYYAGEEVDEFAQRQLMLPTAVLAGCCVFRFSQANDAHKALDGAVLYVLCFVAFFGHLALHWACLKFIIPQFKLPPHQPSKEKYETVAARLPVTWFSANPVHCLRSKYVFKQNPPHIHCVYGKEHLQKANKDLGICFEDSTYGGAYVLSHKICDEEQQANFDHEDEKKVVEDVDY